MVKIMNTIGIYTKEDLLKSDYVTIQEQLKEKNITPHLLIFYSIEMGLQGRRCEDISPQEKRELKRVLKR